MRILGRLGWALVGGMIVLIGALSVWPGGLPYRELIAPASALLPREVPAYPPTIREKIVYVYLAPDVRAVAPRAVTEDVVRFCRPVTVATTDTVLVPSPSLIRTFTVGQTWLPFQRHPLLVTSMDGHGDLIAEDYHVRLPLGVAAGLEAPYRTTVRYPRWGILRDAAHGALWYGAFRLVEAVVR
uniref:Uncharacterized protein n=1 Tax=viral metagenome TaxID=1070528 RepID=A0A6M3XTK8_9ZZZZ